MGGSPFFALAFGHGGGGGLINFFNGHFSPTYCTFHPQSLASTFFCTQREKLSPPPLQSSEVFSRTGLNSATRTDGSNFCLPREGARKNYYYTLLLLYYTTHRARLPPDRESECHFASRRLLCSSMSQPNPTACLFAINITARKSFFRRLERLLFF